MTMVKDTKIWRQDITGLRALAVLPVLIYHAFPNLIPGGFFGVDIFFVISGYLISGIIFRGIQKGNFSFQNFYIKRIKRIIPNLLLVLVFVLFFGWFVTSASEYMQIADNARHSAFFYQNLRLMRGTDYFGMDASLNPLLHIWSLSIEEQFYLLFPLLCVIFWKLAKRFRYALGYFVLFLTFVSFVGFLCINDLTVRFYYPLTRFWELGAGICLAYAEIFCRFDIRNHSIKGASWLSAIGLVLVVTPMLLHGKGVLLHLFNAPGLENLISILGTVLLIVANTDALVNRTLLSWKWMLFIGAISYSLYLWHWPLLVYLRIVFAKPESWQIVLVLFVTFPISYLVYRYVENPVRRLNENKKWYSASVLLLCLVIIFTFGKVTRMSGGFPDRSVAQTLAFLNDGTSDKDLQTVNVLDVQIKATKNSIPEILFVGDSHAAQYISRMVKLTHQTGKSVGFVTAGACMASIGKEYDGTSERCRALPEKINKLLTEDKVKTLVIAQKWGAYGHNGIQVLNEGIAAYKSLAEFFTQRAGRKVFWVLDSPWDEYNGQYDVLRYVGNRFYLKDFFEQNTSVSVAYPKDGEWDEGNKRVVQALTGLGTMIPTAKYVCPNEKCDLMKYRDNDHLRSSYLRDHAIWLNQVFE